MSTTSQRPDVLHIYTSWDGRGIVCSFHSYNRTYTSRASATTK